jgi:hypothetical protein
VIEIFWYFVCVLLIVALLVATNQAIKRTEALQSRTRLIFFCAVVWITAIGAHAYFALNYDFQYDGVTHLREATVVAEDISSGGFSFEPRNFLGNRGYRLYLAILVEYGKAPTLVPQIINGVLAFLSILAVFEAACVATDAVRVPRWLLLIGWFAPSAFLWLPLNLKEAIVVYGIGALLRLFAYASKDSGLYWTRLQDFPGIVGFLLLRPHICIVWCLSLATGAILEGKSLGRSVILLIFLAPATLGSVYLLSIFSPEFFSQAEESGATETLDNFRDDRSSIGNTAVGSSSSNPIVAGLIMTLFSSVEAIKLNPVWIIFAIEGFLVSTPLLIYAFSIKRLSSARRLPMFFGLLFVILGMSVFLGFMYNTGLAVRQRLQVTPGLLMLLSLFCLDPGEDDE